MQVTAAASSPPPPPPLPPPPHLFLRHLRRLNASPAKKSMLMLPSRKSLFSHGCVGVLRSSGELGDRRSAQGRGGGARARAIAEGSATVTPAAASRRRWRRRPPRRRRRRLRSAPAGSVPRLVWRLLRLVRAVVRQLGSIFSDSTRGLRARSSARRGCSSAHCSPCPSRCRYAAGVSFPPTLSPWPKRRFWTNLGDYLQLGNSTLGGAVCERLLPEDAIVHARASEYAEGGQVLSDVICWFGTDGYLSPSWLIPEFLLLLLVLCTSTLARRQWKPTKRVGGCVESGRRRPREDA